MKKIIVLTLCLIGLSGCVKPYHEATLVPIGTSEVAILIETINDEGQAVVAPKGKGAGEEGDAATNARGELVNYYRNRVVNAKVVEIPYYWKQTHKMRFYSWEHSGNGEWQPAARLIVVDTQQETRQWTAEGNNEGIWVESMDSVGFSTGISLTANIEDQADAIVFLSNYKPQQQREYATAGGAAFQVEVTALEQILDTEVRSKIQEVFAYEAAAYNMDELRSKKREIIDSVKETIVPYFKEKGITITTIGQFGGFTYENQQIQVAIDKVFEAQQDEEVAKAEAAAAQERKLALQLAGEGQAQKDIEIARGEAQAIELVADAKSYELEKLQENPEAYLALKQLEVELERLKAWDGKYPQLLFNGETGMNPMILELPSVETQDQ